MWVVYTRHHVEEIAFFLDPFQEPHKVASYLLVVDCDPSSVISEPRPEGANLMISQKETHFLDAPDVAPVKEFISTAFAEVERVRTIHNMTSLMVSPEMCNAAVCRAVGSLFSTPISCSSSPSGMTQRCCGAFTFAWQISSFRLRRGIQECLLELAQV